MSATPQPSEQPVKLGIIAGSGSLPRTMMHACAQSGRPFFLLALEDAADAETIALAGSHTESIRLGAIGKAIDLLRAEACEELVMAGKVHRPKISAIRPDLKGAKLLARVGTQLLTGDNQLLSGIVAFLEEEGFRVVGADNVMRELLAPEGMIGSIYPDKRSQADIEFGAKIARGIGALDIGQSVVVQNHVVIGVEAIEGTDKLMERCAALKPDERGGVLIKVKKPQQDSRVDLPTIGVSTIERAAAAGLAGIAIEAGATLIIDRRDVARRADALGVFVVGFSMVD